MGDSNAFVISHQSQCFGIVLGNGAGKIGGIFQGRARGTGARRRGGSGAADQQNAAADRIDGNSRAGDFSLGLAIGRVFRINLRAASRVIPSLSMR